MEAATKMESTQTIERERVVKRFNIRHALPVNAWDFEEPGDDRVHTGNHGTRV